MQWDGGLPNAGFSSARPEYLYLPQDPSKDRPTVAAQLNDPDSLLNHVRAQLALREAHPELGAGTAARVLNSSYPFVFQRGEPYVVAINPRTETMTARVECPEGDPELLYGRKATMSDEQASSSIASGSGDDAAAMRELNYTPNAFAHGLAGVRRGVIRAQHHRPRGDDGPAAPPGTEEGHGNHRQEDGRSDQIASLYASSLALARNSGQG